MDQFDPLGFHSNLGQQPFHHANPDFRPVVALGQTAFPWRTSDYEQPACAAFEGVKKVLRVRLAAAREFVHLNVDAILCPLTRQTPALKNALATDKNANACI
jgi:hypothetical protein